MNDEFALAIATLRSHLQKQELEVKSTKRLINQLCQRAGEPVMFPDAESDDPVSLASMRRDRFYGMPLATAIREYLEMRRAQGPATVNDIYSALVAGGYKFEAKNEVNAKRSLYISLAKNSVTFHKLPGKTDETAVFGLLEWYPNAKANDEQKKGKKLKKNSKPSSVSSAKKKSDKEVSPDEGADIDSSKRKYEVSV